MSPEAPAVPFYLAADILPKRGRRAYLLIAGASAHGAGDRFRVVWSPDECVHILGVGVNPAYIELVGAVAAMLTTSAFFPQALKTLRTRETGGLSVVMYVMLVVGVSLWLVYGLMIGSMPLILANGIVLVPQLAVLVLLLQQARQAK